MKFQTITALMLTSGLAVAGDCKYERDLDQTLDLGTSDRVMINAKAGRLKVTGRRGNGPARVQGKICASHEEWLEQTEVVTSGGSQPEISVVQPDHRDNGWGQSYLMVHLDIELPDSASADIRDSSGDLEASGFASVDITDSSGDIRISDMSGSVTIRDSSGDVFLRDIGMDVVVVSDSSGDLDGDGIDGSVLVQNDSSGSIIFRRVGGDFIVEKDSSGSIEADDVAGDFRVLRDGSGSVRSKNVRGEIEIPEKY